jgi:hypothetical protein
MFWGRSVFQALEYAAGGSIALRAMLVSFRPVGPGVSALACAAGNPSVFQTLPSGVPVLHSPAGYAGIR